MHLGKGIQQEHKKAYQCDGPALSDFAVVNPDVVGATASVPEASVDQPQRSAVQTLPSLRSASKRSSVDSDDFPEGKRSRTSCRELTQPPATLVGVLNVGNTSRLMFVRPSVVRWRCCWAPLGLTVHRCVRLLRSCLCGNFCNSVISTTCKKLLACFSITKELFTDTVTLLLV